MEKENTNLDFRLKKQKKDETRNYFLEEIKHNQFGSKKHNRSCKSLNYVEHLLILASTSIVFACVIGILVELKIGLEICVKTNGLKCHKSLIKKKRKNTIEQYFQVKLN